MDRIKGKVAIVTGAGGLPNRPGIGRGIALAFAREGANIVVADIDSEGVTRVAKEVKALGVEALPIEVDVSKSAAVKRMVEETVKRFGTVDILVNCAYSGSGRGISTLELPEETWDRDFEVSLKGTFLCCQAVGRALVSQKKSGKIINLASMAGIRASRNTLTYVSSKHGVIGLTKSLAVDWGPYQINVNCIAPGSTNQPLTPEREERARNTPIGRNGRVEDIANLAVYLASAESDWVTGITIPIDGGLSALNPSYYGRKS